MIDYPTEYTIEQKQALARALFLLKLQGSESRPIGDFVSMWLKRLDKANRHETDTAAWIRRQGACQVLERLEIMIEEARDNFGAFDQMRRQAAAPVGGAPI